MDNKSSDFHTFLCSRRSIRRFKQDSISSDIIQRILDTAIYSPSAHNMQPWYFVVLTTDEVKLHLMEAITAKYGKDMAKDGIPEANIQSYLKKSIRRVTKVPVVLVLCLDRKRVKKQPDRFRRRAEIVMSIQSVASAGLQILLAAHAEGLGGNWICWPLFAPKETRAALGLASHLEPQALILLGHPAEIPEVSARLPVHDVTLYL